MNKSKFAFLIAILSLTLFSFKPDDKDQSFQTNNLFTVDSRVLDINNISNCYRNNGSFHRNPNNGNSLNN